MHYSVQNLNNIKEEINTKASKFVKNNIPNIIAVSKTFPKESVFPLIEYGHLDFGENKVQEALEKWSDLKFKNKNIRLHLLGKLQRNKVKDALKIFDFIHSIDSEKLAKKISDEQILQNKKIKIFIQVNIGDEQQKSGIPIGDLENFYSYCKKINLNVIGLMCIPPAIEDPERFFLTMKKLSDSLNLVELSMGMSGDYLKAINHSSTYIRIGTAIFGKRT
jgi:pyridoxal phosphate enzyme (YggS family)